jgi:predicted dehydrogenase
MKNKQKKYKAIIIGAGKIAAGFDAPGDKKILTHAHALKKHPEVELVGFFDIDGKAATRAAKKWSCQSFSSFEEAMKTHSDIVAICVPSEHHYSILYKLLEFKPKLVICEKPLTVDLASGEKAAIFYKKAGIPILVNYFRRFDSVVRRVKQEIDSGRYGKVLAAYGIYNKGILNNGSHLIDLARFLFGDAKRARSHYQINDYSKKDKSVAGFLEFERCPQFHLITGDSRLYKIWELNILLEKGSLNFVESGMILEKRTVKEDKIYSGYKILSKAGILKTEFDKAMLEMVGNAVDHLSGSAPLLCDAEDALKDQGICSDLIKISRHDDREK